jgi:glycosyltransferase involved in cell wall biosynthesis
MFPERLVKTMRRTRARWEAAAGLRRVSGSPAEGGLAFAVVRNEMLRLPRFLDHYREMGVSGFVIVENNSTDSTREFLAAQKDVCLYTTAHRFTGKEAWLDCLLRRHGRGRWCLVVDADELLDYPESDRVRLPAFCQYLEEIGANAVHAILLDLYPEGPVSEVGYAAGEDYFLQPWYFDGLESLTKAPRVFFRGSGLDHRLEGGTRKRLFGVTACCSKFPLFRYQCGMFLTDGQHYLEGGRFSELRAVLYHFKYLQDFAPHVEEEVQRGEHWGGAIEYRAYADKVAREGSQLQIWTPDSIRLNGPRQLEDLGFLIRPDSYNDYLAKSQGNHP